MTLIMGTSEIQSCLRSSSVSCAFETFRSHFGMLFAQHFVDVVAKGLFTGLAISCSCDFFYYARLSEYSYITRSMSLRVSLRRFTIH